MPLAPGTRIGAYEVVGPLGEGGMGVVYRARDTKLQREAALKVLPDAVAADRDRLARFEREARTLAALNHTNIAQIYGFEEAGGVSALAMELVEGPTLADRIADGAVLLEEALPIARQIAEALEAAHEQGIIHRDLKPANIKVRPDGTVKVLDFGLAKALDPVGGSVDGSLAVSQAATITSPALRTGAGMLLGTAAYMSPEQAKGQPADKRSDVWAFGAVLFEMLTGRRAFDGDDVVEVLGAVTRLEPEWSRLPADLPPAVRALLQGCLRKDRRHRVADVAALLFVLRDLDTAPRSEPAVTSTAATRPGSRRLGLGSWGALGAAVLLTAGATAVAVRLVTRPPEFLAVTRVAVTTPPDLRISRGMPSLSPDGRWIAFVANRDGEPRQLWLRDLSSGSPRPLPGTEGANLPFWSPDGRSIGFFAGGKLKRTDLAGGAVQVLCDAGQARGGTWSAGGTIVFAPRLLGELFRVSASGGAPIQLTTLASGELSHRYPWFLPDGRRYLYVSQGELPERTALYVGDLETKRGTRIMPVASNVVYASGHLLFARNLTLMAQPFDPVTAQTTGDARPLAEGVGYIAVDSRAYFSSSETGAVAFSRPASVGNQLQWFDRAGQPGASIELPLDMSIPAISPDGRRVAFRGLDAQTGRSDVWVYDLERATPSRMTFNQSDNLYPRWSPDQRYLAYYKAGRDGGGFRRATSGAGDEERLEGVTGNPSDYSPDGRYLVQFTVDRRDIWIHPLAGDRTPYRYLEGAANESEARVSPSGRWLAYQSDESGRSEIYVQSFPRAGGGKWQLSSGGGGSPLWSRDGRELYYVSADQKLTSVRTQDGATFSTGPQQALFDFPGAGGGSQRLFDVGRDGRFLISVDAATAREPIDLILNWPAAWAPR